jgi:hypothetical protein
VTSLDIARAETVHGAKISNRKRCADAGNTSPDEETSHEVVVGGRGSAEKTGPKKSKVATEPVAAMAPRMPPPPSPPPEAFASDSGAPNMGDDMTAEYGLAPCYIHV